MRKELSTYMNGEPVCLIGKVLGFGCNHFDGEKRLNHTDPQTCEIVPARFFPSNAASMPIKLIDKTTLIKPISINGIPIKNIDHMWISQHFLLSEGTVFMVHGHIDSYDRNSNGECGDFCFVPYDEPQKIPSLSPN